MLAGFGLTSTAALERLRASRLSSRSLPDRQRQAVAAPARLRPPTATSADSSATPCRTRVSRYRRTASRGRRWGDRGPPSRLRRPARAPTPRRRAAAARRAGACARARTARPAATTRATAGRTAPLPPATTGDSVATGGRSERCRSWASQLHRSHRLSSAGVAARSAAVSARRFVLYVARRSPSRRIVRTGRSIQPDAVKCVLAAASMVLRLRRLRCDELAAVDVRCPATAEGGLALVLFLSVVGCVCALRAALCGVRRAVWVRVVRWVRAALRLGSCGRRRGR